MDDLRQWRPSPSRRRSAMMAVDTGTGESMELHERRFLTAADMAYLEEVEVALVRVHRVSPERANRAIRAVARELQQARTLGDGAVPTALLPYGGAAAHAEVLAALLVTPRAPTRISLAMLALLAAVAGLLGMRVVLALVFRRFEPMRIGWIDVTLAIVVVGVILGAARSIWLPDRLGRINWFWVSLVLGVSLGIGATALLRAADVHRTVVTLPLWLAAAIAAVCGALTWLLTWPDDQNIYRGVE